MLTLGKQYILERDAISQNLLIEYIGEVTNRNGHLGFLFDLIQPQEVITDVNTMETQKGLQISTAIAMGGHWEVPPLPVYAVMLVERVPVGSTITSEGTVILGLATIKEREL